MCDIESGFRTMLTRLSSPTICVLPRSPSRCCHFTDTTLFGSCLRKNIVLKIITGSSKAPLLFVSRLFNFGSHFRHARRPCCRRTFEAVSFWKDNTAETARSQMSYCPGNRKSASTGVCGASQSWWTLSSGDGGGVGGGVGSRVRRFPPLKRDFLPISQDCGRSALWVRCRRMCRRGSKTGCCFSDRKSRMSPEYI